MFKTCAVPTQLWLEQDKQLDCAAAAIAPNALTSEKSELTKYATPLTQFIACAEALNGVREGLCYLETWQILIATVLYTVECSNS